MGGVRPDRIGGGRIVEPAAVRKKTEAQEAKEKADDAAVLFAFDRLAETDTAATRRKVRDNTRLNSDRFNKAVERLLAEGLVREEDAEVSIGSGARRRMTILRRGRGEK